MLVAAAHLMVSQRRPHFPNRRPANSESRGCVLGFGPGYARALMFTCVLTVAVA
jgi:hypothetical protein